MNALKWLGTAAAGVVLFALAGGAFIAALWAVSEHVTDPALKTVAAIVFALAFLLAVLAGIVAAFGALRLTNPRQALALPEGSIRAIIALVLVLIFVIMAIYLIETVFVDDTNEDARNVATQLLATLGTLVAAVAAFYFGTSAVTTGTTAAAEAAAEAVTASRARPPGAVTKGSKRVHEGYELHAFVNPQGRETTYYFEYGEKKAYGETTAPTIVAAGNTEQLVSSDRLSKPRPKWHFRVVAHSDVGTTYGDDATIDSPMGEREPEGGGPDRPRDRERSEERERRERQSEREKPERQSERERKRSRAEPEREAKKDQEEEGER